MDSGIDRNDLVSLGNREDDLPKLRGYDWVIEVVAENLEIERNLLKMVADHLHPRAILTTNTSGLPVASIADHLSESIEAPLVWHSLL